MKFTPPEPYQVPPLDLVGFDAGILRVRWVQPVESFEVSGRTGRVYVARVVECRTRTGRIKTEGARAMLHGMIVRAPDGALSRIAGLETFLMMEMGVSGPAGDVGILLVPVGES
jgi:hypothetical protein